MASASHLPSSWIDQAALIDDYGLKPEHITDLLGPAEVIDGERLWPRARFEHIARTVLAPAILTCSQIDVLKFTGGYDKPDLEWCRRAVSGDAGDLQHSATEA